MKGYRNFLVVFTLLFALYIVAELNKPKAINWEISLSKDDKDPYGAYVLFKSLKELLPTAAIESYRTPVYNQVNNYTGRNGAYLIISPDFKPSGEDLAELDRFVRRGNVALISASDFAKSLQRKLRFTTSSRMSLGLMDSTSVNLVNPQLRNNSNYVFRRMTIDEYFSKIDTANSTVLGINDRGRPNFIRVKSGAGVYLVHAAPLCFSNYFMLYRNNASYTSKVLSYLPQNTNRLFWDEYYKLGPTGPTTPLRFILSNPYLLAAFRLGLIALVLYVLFEMKRRQRIIPVIEPLKNTTLEFAKTIAGLYYQQKDNQGIARKKINYFLDFVRNRYFIPTTALDSTFLNTLSQKSGVALSEVEPLVASLREIDYDYPVSDTLLLTLNTQIDNFYKQVK
ncbi:DUF4350 domain-containing protein [Segetibacter sp. 3557_3]|uniref:DUF4350 domain-containing protein n=1 Tax=Segetibacter sp. 3557_3 TaxID=2547429 RepID=UPI00105889B0|nr:DUF4350 domain-containing protein [Segetibacter sp. 3557_3]TDH28768.1 DUF4350 domain-containing protein [Segetibacter sp. 3557_3]